MLKKLPGVVLLLILHPAVASKSLDLYQASISSIKQFPIVSDTRTPTFVRSNNVLRELHKTSIDVKNITRYQQFYRGIELVGAQVTLSNEGGKVAVNGRLWDDVQLNTKAAISKQQSIEAAKKAWSQYNSQIAITEEQSQLQIRAGHDNKLMLAYLVSFKTQNQQRRPTWPFFVVDAHSGKVVKQWNNIKQFADTGPGGNEKVKKYWYGKDGLPPLKVTKRKNKCTMENPLVKVVNLQFAWDWDHLLSKPYSYTCSENQEDYIHGAFSPINDAYYFGQVIGDMYKSWYGVHVLQNKKGERKQLVMRVHFGEAFDNAFWDGECMSFGDGQEMYPLVALDIVGHEITHGFTEQHAALEYHDESGALNESVSDMAAQAAKAYLLEKSPLLYNKIHLTPDVITWGIGETVMFESGVAMRYMDSPSKDGGSADCFDKELAKENGGVCEVSYHELVELASQMINSPEEQQDFIVHTGSGVFNKAFYLLSEKLGIKKAYQLMVIANSKYWTSTSNFVHAACGVLYAAQDQNMNLDLIKPVFGQVGIDVTQCMNERDSSQDMSSQSA